MAAKEHKRRTTRLKAKFNQVVDFDSEASGFQEFGAQSTVSMSVFGDRKQSMRDEFKNYPEKRTASNKKKARPMSAVVKPSQSMSYLSSVG